MKLLIQDLSDKAKRSVPHGLTPDKWIEVYNEKFAELIVRECADTVLGFHNQFGDSAHDEIREHFGVEE